MRKIFTMMLILSISTAASSIKAQSNNNEAQEIISFTKIKMPVEWYKKQSKLWEQKVKADSKNEINWKNWLTALHYAVVTNEATTDSITFKERSRAMRLLIETLPESPTRYIMEFYMKGPHHADSRKITEKVFNTIKENPDRIDFYDDYLAYLLMEHPEEKELIADICRRWYTSGNFSSTLLNYFYNELSGMPENSIIIASGDSPIYSYLILQNAKELFKSIRSICMPLLFVENYRNHICKELGIAQFDEKDINDTDKMLLHIIKESKRPVYFSLTSQQPSFSEKLYSEGLVSRYSEESYDNIAAKRRNIETNYLLDYLRELRPRLSQL